MDLPNAMRELSALVEVEADCKTHYEDAKRKREDHERKVLEHMEQQDVPSIKVGNLNYIRAKTIYPTVQDRDAFIQWAAENDESLTEVKERKAQIGELVRERIDNGEVLPPGLGFYVKEYVSKRAA